MEYSLVDFGFSLFGMGFPPVIFVEDHRKEKAPVISHRSYPIVSKVIALWLAAIVTIATILVLKEARLCRINARHIYAAGSF